MAFFLKKNCARTTINQVGGIDSSATSLVVADASPFPSTGDFILTIWNKATFPDPCDDPNVEIIKVTGVSSNTFTIVRGQEDSVGVVHSNGQAVEMLITAGILENIEDEINILSPGEQVRNEILTSQIDGATDSFTTSFNYVSNTLEVFVGGLMQSPGASLDYTETGANSFQLNFTPVSGEVMLVRYTKS